MVVVEEPLLCDEEDDDGGGLEGDIIALMDMFGECF